MKTLTLPLLGLVECSCILNALKNNKKQIYMYSRLIRISYRKQSLKATSRRIYIPSLLMYLLVNGFQRMMKWIIPLKFKLVISPSKQQILKTKRIVTIDGQRDLTQLSSSLSVQILNNSTVSMSTS